MARKRLVRRVAAAGALLGLAACGGNAVGDSGASVSTNAVTTVTTAAPAIAATAPPTTLATTTTTTLATTTTAAPTTLPRPLAPPNPSAPEKTFQIGTISIPKIGLVHSMWEGVADSTLNHGPGHWPGTAMPGQVGNVVLGGHRVSHDRPFRHIDELVPGDQIVMSTLAGQFTYVVSGSQVVTPQDVWIVNQTPSKTLTLFACHPPGSTRERYVVFAKLAGT
jgi:sortase A